MPKQKIYSEEELRIRRTITNKKYQKAHPENYRKASIKYHNNNKQSINERRRHKYKEKVLRTKQSEIENKLNIIALKQEVAELRLRGNQDETEIS